MSEHIHDHDHDHDHEHNSPEETLALLTYLLDHNRHHAEELHDLAHGLDWEASELLHEAVADYRQGNDKLAEALAHLRGE